MTLLANEALFDFFRCGHEIYVASNSLSVQVQLNRRARAKSLRGICLYQDLRTGRLYKTPVALESPAVAKELTGTLSHAEIEFEAKIQRGSDEVKSLCPPGTLFFDLDAPPFARILHEDPLKRENRIHSYLAEINPDLASAWPYLSSRLYFAAACCAKIPSSDGSGAEYPVIFEYGPHTNGQKAFEGFSALSKELIEYAPPLPKQFQRFVTCHESAHANEPPLAPNTTTKEIDALYMPREVNADKRAMSSFLLMGGSPKIVEAYMHGQALWALLASHTERNRSTALLLDNITSWENQPSFENISRANRELRQRAIANLTRAERTALLIKSFSTTARINISRRLIQSTRDLLYRGDFAGDPLMQRAGELVVEAALFHCPTTILADLPTIDRSPSDNCMPSHAREQLKALLQPTGYIT